MNTKTPCARVFIGCGQSKESDEAQIAGAIHNRLNTVRNGVNGPLLLLCGEPLAWIGMP
jgi:hypothetical protein